MINTSQSELEVLAFPRSIFSVPTRDIVYDPSLLRAIPEPMWFKQDLVEQNPQFKQIVPFIMFFCDGKALTFTNGSSHSLGLHDHIVFEDGDYLSGFLRIYNALSIQSVGVPSSRYIGLIK